MKTSSRHLNKKKYSTHLHSSVFYTFNLQYVSGVLLWNSHSLISLLNQNKWNKIKRKNKLCNAKRWCCYAITIESSRVCPAMECVKRCGSMNLSRDFNYLINRNSKFVFFLLYYFSQCFQIKIDPVFKTEAFNKSNETSLFSPHNTITPQDQGVYLFHSFYSFKQNAWGRLTIIKNVCHIFFLYT